MLHFCTVLLAENTLLCFNLHHIFAPKYDKISASIYKNASASGGLDPLRGITASPLDPTGGLPSPRPSISCPQPQQPGDATVPFKPTEILSYTMLPHRIQFNAHDLVTVKHICRKFGIETENGILETEVPPY